jgi:thiol-disulfide isomerase/thioredoxin
MGDAFPAGPLGKTGVGPCGCLEDMGRQARVRAPELHGRGGWIHTGDKELRLAELRGRVVLLDFWTSGCVNCLHVLDELRALEERHPDLVVLGVHSPKFPHESEHAAVLDAMERYAVTHPVLDDAGRDAWDQYAVRAWPTLVLIDPEGYVVTRLAGEGHGPELDRLIAELESEHAAKGTLRRGDDPYVPPDPEPTVLRFPGRALVLPSGNVLVSDTTRHQLVEFGPGGRCVRRRIGEGGRGAVDGSEDRAQFDEPQGMALLPDGTVAVADSGGHRLRRLDPETGRVTTLAGTGRPWRRGDAERGPGRRVNLSSPWDLAWWRDRLWIAMAGIHQLWTYDPEDGTVEAVVGTREEGLLDGPAAQALLAQPSGLAAAGDRLWFADAESSSVRWLDADGIVRTAAGTGLFSFGFQDGPVDRALFQHPLAVTALPDGSVAVCDAYNDAVRRLDPVTGQVGTLAGGLREPTGAVLAGDLLLVVESAAHRLTPVPLPPAALRPPAVEERPVTAVAPGTLRLEVSVRLPEGQKSDTRYGPSTRLRVTATPPGLLKDGEGAGHALTRPLLLDPSVPEAVLHVTASAASCDADPGLGHPACRVHRRHWDLPVRVADDGTGELGLLLDARDAAGVRQRGALR